MIVSIEKKAWAMRFKRIVFDLLFINTFSITMIYYILPSLSSFVTSSIVVAIPIFLAVLFIILNLMYKQRVRLNTLYLFLIVLIYIIFSLLGNEFISNIANSSSFIVYVVFSWFLINDNDIEDLVKHLKLDTYIIGIIYIIACVFYSTGRLYSDNSAVSYMTLGYGMSFPTMLSFEFYRKSKKYNDLALPVCLSVLILTFGNRGALVMVVLYLMVWSIQVYKGYFSRKAIVVMLVTFGITLLFLIDGGSFITGVLATVLEAIGFDSRNIVKLISGSVLIDRDRSMIAERAYELIQENPFALRGPGALTREFISSDLIGANAHNMVLELWVEYGVIIGTYVSFFLYKQVMAALSLKSYKEKNCCGILAFTLIFQAMVMLFFSGTLYSCSALWLGLAMISACNVRERRLL